MNFLASKHCNIVTLSSTLAWTRLPSHLSWYKRPPDVIPLDISLIHLITTTLAIA